MMLQAYIDAAEWIWGALEYFGGMLFIAFIVVGISLAATGK